MSERRQRIAADMQRHLAARSPAGVKFFSQIFELTLRRHFYAVRVANRPPPPLVRAPHLVLFSNHSSWWDGAVFLFVAEHLLGRRPGYTPMDAAMLRRYKFFKSIGAFGVDQGSLLGALSFMEGARLVLEDPRNVLMVAAQGRFADARERPLRLESGIAHITRVVPGVVYLPVAIEYTYWQQKRPELLLRFGAPVHGRELAERPMAAQIARLEDALTGTMDDLAQDAMARNEAAFELFLRGKSGINLFYDLWRRAAAFAGNRAFRADHGPEA